MKKSSGDNNFNGRNTDRVTINDKRENIDNIILSNDNESIKELKPSFSKVKKTNYLKNIMIVISLIIVISFGLIGVYTLTDLFTPKSLELGNEKVQGISGQEIDVEVYIKPYLISYRLESEDSEIAYIKDNKLYAKAAGTTKVLVYSQRGSLVDTITVKILDKNNRYDYGIDFDIETDESIIVGNVDDYKNQTIISGRLAMEVPNPHKIGYEFVGWYKDSEFAKKFTFEDPIINDLKLYPRWKVIDIQFGNGEAIKLNNAKYKEDYLITLNKYVSGGSLGGAPEGSEALGDFKFELSKSHFEREENRLPLGLNLSSNGIINGYPLETGNFSFIVKVIDKVNNSFEEAEFKISIDKQVVSLNYNAFSNVIYDGKIVDEAVIVENEYLNLYVTDNIIAKVVLKNDNDVFNKNVGKYTITVVGLEGEGSENYILPETNLTHTFVVKQKDAEIEFFSDDKNNKNFNLLYSGETRALNAKISNLCEKDTSEVYLTYDKEEIKNYGEYTASVSAISNQNYKIVGTIEKKFTISKATAYLSITSGQKKVYGEKDLKIDYTLIDKNKSLSDDEIEKIKNYIDEKLIREVGENVGHYSFSINKNYEDYRIANIILNDNLAEDLYYQITSRELKIEGDFSKIYDKNIIVSNANLHFNDNGVVNNDKVDFVGQYADLKAGKDIKIKFDLINNELGNYRLNGSYLGEIKQKEVELEFESINQTYDGNEKNVNIIVSKGLCDGDVASINVIYNNPDRTEIGKFTAIAESIDNPNYKLPIDRSKVYEIIKREVTVKSNLNKYYKIYDGTTNVTFVKNDNINKYLQFENIVKEDILYLYGYNALLDSSNVASATKITLSNLRLASDVKNYTLVTEEFEIPAEITAKDIEVEGKGIISKTFDNKQEVIFGDDSFHNYYQFLNLVEKDNLELSTFVLSYNSADTTASKVNVSEIAIIDTNYNLITTSFEVDGKINALEVEVVWTEKEYIYNGNDQKDSIKAFYNDVNQAKIDLVVSNGEFKDCGEYTFTASFANDEINYKLLSSTKNYDIKRANLELTADNKTITYGDIVPKFTFTLTGGSYLNVEDENHVKNNVMFTTSYDIAIPTNRGAGEYSIEINYDNSNYEITLIKGTLTVEKYDITLTAEDKTAIYGDESIEFTYSLTKLLFDEDESAFEGSIIYTTNYEKITSANANGITVTPSGFTSNDYNITYVSGDININKKNITVAFSGYKSLIYNGQERTIDAVFNGLVNNDIVTPILEVTDSKVIKNADSYTITAINNNTNYNLVDITEVTFDIQQADITLTANDEKINYGDNEPNFTFGVTSGKFHTEEDENTANNGVVLSSEYDINEPTKRIVGIYDIALSYTDSNYNITTINGKLEVAQKDITVAFSGHENLTYDGTVKNINASFNGLVYGDIATPILVVTDNKEIKNAGSYTITATNNNTNYNLVDITKVIFEIERAAITLTAEGKNITYGEIEPTHTFSITSGKFHTEEDENTANNGVVLNSEYDINDSTKRNVGTYDITLSYTDSNYNITAINGKLEVAQKDITVTFSGYESLTYNGQERTIGAVFSGLVNNDIVIPTLVVTDDKVIKNAGSYTITAANDNANYNLTGTVEVTFIINVADATVTTLPATKAYGEENPQFNIEFSGFFEEVSYEVTTIATSSSAPGEYALTITRRDDFANYNITYTETAKLTITMREISSVSVSNIEVVTYDGSALEPSFNIKESLAHLELTNGDYSFSYSNNTNAGIDTGEILITAKGTRYQGEKIVKFTINKKDASLTVKAITLQYGEITPKLTVVDDGFIETYAFDATTIRLQGSDVGTYNIIITQRAELTNYNIAYNNATITVVPRQLTVTKDVKDYVYNGQSQEMEVTVGNVYNNDDIGLNITYKCDNVVCQPIKVNIYSATISINNTNYAAADTLFEHKISKRELTVTAKEVKKEYGSMHTYNESSYTLINLVEGDKVMFELSSLDELKSSAKSEFDITLKSQSGKDIGQYEMIYVSAKLTVVPKKIALSVKEDLNNLQQIYQNGIETQVPLTIYPVGMIDGDTVEVIYQAFHESDPDTACQIIKAGTYTIKTTVSNNKNYEISADDKFLKFDITVKPYSIIL